MLQVRLACKSKLLGIVVTGPFTSQMPRKGKGKGIMRPSIASTSKQLDLQCSMQTYHHPNQLH